MFNNLDNKDTTTKKQSEASPQVDDIFAETDKAPQESARSPQETSGLGGDISVQKVGLAVDEQLAEKKSENTNKSWFKWALIGIIIVILILSAYLVYNKFFKSPALINTIDTNSNLDIPKKNNTKTDNPLKNNQEKNSTVSPSANNDLGSFVATSSGDLSNGFRSEAQTQTKIPDIPGVNVPLTTSTLATSTKVIKSLAPTLTDSDLDGLSNADEINIYNTDPNNADSDEDNLSDYDEVKIYHSDPNNPDSDGDTYTDGQEVKGGYNPLGAGKLGESPNETNK